MKKTIVLGAALVCALLPLPRTAAGAEESAAAYCKSAYLCDFQSGTEVFEQNAEAHLPIASMCKIMTLLLSFEAEERGELDLSEQITVSERAAGMGGSQVFLQENLSYTAGDLIKSIAVCSANDSCVAVAERLCGSEEAFVERMNERAKQLGAENTLFSNCTGLPKEPQYSCAKDVSRMLRALLEHEKYFAYSRVWLEDFSHPDGRVTTITNTNKLIRFYEGCDGGKTGFTQQAGYCLAATAQRGGMRLVSVVIGADTSEHRFAATKQLLDRTFGAYENRVLLKEGEQAGAELDVRGGKKKRCPVRAERDLTLFCKKGADEKTEIRFCLDEAHKAPVRAGERAGEAVLYRDGREYARCALLAAEEVEKSNWADAFRDAAKNWN